MSGTYSDTYHDLYGSAMVISGIDQSSRPPPSASALVKAGIKFANHYVADRWTQPVSIDDPATWPTKCLRPAEVKAYVRAGIAMFTNWETSADAMKAGYGRGQTAAANAARMARLCGAPDDMVIYFSADWGATYDDYTGGIAPFLNGAHAALGRNHAGKRRAALYGGIYPITWAFRDGLIDYGWQTAAWSRDSVTNKTLWHPSAQLRQYPDADLGRYHTTIDGVECDIDHAMAADYGQWASSDPPEEDIALDAETKAYLDDQFTKTRQKVQDATALLLRGDPTHPDHLAAIHTDTQAILKTAGQAADPATVAALIAGQLEIVGISTDTGGVVTVTFGPKATT